MSPPAAVVPDGPLIVGVDAADRARDAIALSQQLAPGLPGEIEAVYIHTLEGLSDLMGGRRLQEVERSVAEDGAAKLSEVRTLAAQMGIEEVQMRQAATPAEGLYAQLVESEASIVVIGSSERSGLGKLLPGGTAERLLSASPVAVAVAPNGYADREKARDVVGVGFDDSPESRLAVEWAADIAGRSGASLRLLAVHALLPFGGLAVGGDWGTMAVNEVLGSTLQSAMDALARDLESDLTVESHLLSGDPPGVLAGQSKGLDLLVLGSRGYGPAKSVLLGSVSSQVIKDAHCPVLIVPRAAATNAAAS
jgi:nucleotide-binding universal stress UspA family protein